MKKFQLILVFLLTFCTQIFALADLVCTFASIESSLVTPRGELFALKATITNNGNVVAVSNSLVIYFTQDLNISDDELISKVSVKQLSPGESQEVYFVYPIAPIQASGDYFVALSIDPNNIVQESEENNVFCVSNANGCSTFNITNAVVHYQKYTYPIIFIHGWTSNSESWNDFTNFGVKNYSWTNGGQLNYCLNPDDNQSTSISGGLYTSQYNASSLVMGDFYYINFDVSTNGVLYVGNDSPMNGFNDNYSNQSAIVKQGKTLQDAIEKVLAVSGANKVILVGHSMGGLAAREYLQNSSNWQADGEHHVAKLLTIATPNGGSNATSGGLVVFAGKDEFSEAARDLRYNEGIFNGLYLNGGLESQITIFHNGDVNCNGVTGDAIVGLNQKYSPSDLSYSCIVGDLIIGDGDGVVDSARANLGTYIKPTPPLHNLVADKFVISGTSTTNPLYFHSEIHQKNNSTIIKGLDEAYEYATPYSVPINSLNYGWVTEQATNNLYTPRDWDDYKFTIPSSGTLNIAIYNIYLPDFSVNLLNSSLNVLQSIQSNGESNIYLSAQVTQGDYIFEISGIANTASYLFPYCYYIAFTPTSGLTADFQSNVQQGCSPLSVQYSNASTGSATSFAWSFPGGSPATSTQQNPTVSYANAGTYSATLTISNSSNNSTQTKNSYIKVNSKPVADFTTQIYYDNKVKFLNQTNNT
jgi:pimeloyl-ACP methyl ester carboxylesterase